MASTVKVIFDVPDVMTRCPKFVPPASFARFTVAAMVNGVPGVNVPELGVAVSQTRSEWTANGTLPGQPEAVMVTGRRVAVVSNKTGLGDAARDGEQEGVGDGDGVGVGRGLGVGVGVGVGFDFGDGVAGRRVGAAVGGRGVGVEAIVGAGGGGVGLTRIVEDGDGEPDGSTSTGADRAGAAAGVGDEPGSPPRPPVPDAVDPPGPPAPAPTTDELPVAPASPVPGADHTS
jgi:hypothetical protein